MYMLGNKHTSMHIMVNHDSMLLFNAHVGNAPPQFTVVRFISCCSVHLLHVGSSTLTTVHLSDKLLKSENMPRTQINYDLLVDIDAACFSYTYTSQCITSACGTFIRVT